MGLNVTRALTCRHNAQLSAGRVQTPTLALIVEREEAIRRFVPQEFWTVTAKLPGFTATWRDPNGQARLFDRERAEALAARLAGTIPYELMCDVNPRVPRVYLPGDRAGA